MNTRLATKPKKPEPKAALAALVAAPPLQPAPQLFTGEKLLRMRDVEEKTGLGRSSIYRQIRAGTFPSSYPAGPGSVRWKLSEVEAWIARLPHGGEGPGPSS